MKFSTRKAGFTMLELLAVLAIVLILSAILFPAIESARERSLTTACSQNVKQLVLALTQYEQDKGRYPAGRFFTNASPTASAATDITRWYNAISPYMHAGTNASSVMSVPLAFPPVATTHQTQLALAGVGDEIANGVTQLYPKSYQCPSVSNWDVASMNMSYGYNFQYLGNADPRSVLTALAPNVTGYVNFPVAKSSITRPDRTIAFADSDGTGWLSYASAATAGPAATTAPEGGPNPQRIGAYGYLIDPTFLPLRNIGGTGILAEPNNASSNLRTLPPTAAGLVINAAGGLITLNTFGADQSAQQLRGIVSSRHKGQANIGFLDGHVETLVREDLYFAPCSQGGPPNVVYLSNEYWNTFGEDNDQNGDGVILAASNERVSDENEKFTVAGLTGPPAPPATGYAGTVWASTEYNPAAAPVPGYGAVAGLLGNFAQWGPGYDITLNNFLITNNGPTLPKVGPFKLDITAAGVQ